MTSAIEPALLKLVDTTLTFNWKGDLTLSSLVRACASLHSGMKDQRTDQQQYIEKAGAPSTPTSLQSVQPFRTVRYLLLISYLESL